MNSTPAASRARIAETARFLSMLPKIRSVLIRKWPL
jgi:hypothetical protein